MMALYVILVSLAYGVLWKLNPHAANAVIGVIVLFLLVPAVVWEVKWWKRGRDARP